MTENSTDTQEEGSLDSFISSWESEGAEISLPVLNEGNYKAHIVELTTRCGITTDKKTNEERAWQNWGVKLALDSATASEIMGRDGDVIVYADGDTTVLGRGYLTLFKYGIDRSGNAALWKFVGLLFAQAGLATCQKDDSGAETFNIDQGIVKSIYQGTEAKLAELQEDTEQDVRLIPAKLAELQFKNLTELLTSEQDTSRVYAHMSRRSDYRDNSKKQHFVKNIMFPDAFEADQSKMDSLVL